VVARHGEDAVDAALGVDVGEVGDGVEEEVAGLARSLR
jgi:hypothetical protein